MDQNNLDSIPDSISTLEDLSVIPAAIHLCNLLNVKKKIEDFLDQLHPPWRQEHRKLLKGSYLRKLLKNISKVFLKELSLPPALKPKILDEILKITERIHDWILHVICDLELNSRYIEKVYLTPYGEIDEDKIFKSLWMNFALDKSSLEERNEVLHYLACFFFQEEYIINNLDEIKNEIHSITAVKNVSVFTIMKFLLYATDQGKKWKKDDPSITISRRIFSLSDLKFLDICFEHGFYRPFIYFWNHLNDSEKSNYLQNISRSHYLCYCLRYLRANFVAENLFKIVIFLTDKMSESQVDDFVLRFFMYFDLFFDKSKCSNKFSILFIHKFLPRLSQISENNNLYPNFGCEKGFLENVFYVFEKPLLKSVICHEIYKNRRDYVLSFGKAKYRKLILHNNFDCLNEFMDLFLKTENEKSQFKIRYNFLQECIYLGKWNKVDNILTWMQTLSTTDKRNIIQEQLKYAEVDNVLTWMQTLRPIEKQNIYQGILKDPNAYNVLANIQTLTTIEKRNMVQQHFKYPEKDNVLTWELLELSETEKQSIIHEKLKQLIPKLLKWFADTDNEPLVNNCEDPPSVMELTREIIYKLWFSSVNDSAAKISPEILKCVFGTENKIINFKKSELTKNEIVVVKFFCDTKLEMNEEVRANFSRIDEFFNFCLSEEKIEGVKKLIAEYVQAWIVNYGVSVRRFDIVVPLLDWIYGSENENCEMLKKYFKNHSDLENYYRSIK